MRMSNTLDYYNENADAFVSGTKDVDFSEIQNLFLSYLKEGAHILDFGCGAGRDAKIFYEKGYAVDAVDGSEKLCAFAREYTGLPVQQMLFSELSGVDIYDGIWACASILHAPLKDLPDIFRRMIVALHLDGIIYTSFKYGNGENQRGERFFTDFTEETMTVYLKQFPELQVRKMWVTSDVRPGRGEERWLNMILQKSTMS